MWWLINKEGERVYAVESKEEAIKRLDDWLVDYVYVGQKGGVIVVSLHKDFVKRLQGSEGNVQSTQTTDKAGNIEHTAVTAFIKRDDEGKVQLLTVAKYFWLQTETDEHVPSLQDMLHSELMLIAEEIPLFIDAVNSIDLDAE